MYLYIGLIIFADSLIPVIEILLYGVGISIFMSCYQLLSISMVACDH